MVFLLHKITVHLYLANTDKPLYIGAGRTNKHPHDVDPPQFHFNGKIDDVAIWNSTLSSDEIVQLYNSGETLYAGDNYGNYTSCKFFKRILDYGYM